MPDASPFTRPHLTSPRSATLSNDDFAGTSRRPVPAPSGGRRSNPRTPRGGRQARGIPRRRVRHRPKPGRPSASPCPCRPHGRTPIWPNAARISPPWPLPSAGARSHSTSYASWPMSPPRKRTRSSVRIAVTCSVRQLAELARSKGESRRASTDKGRDGRWLRFSDTFRTVTAQLPPESYAEVRACLEARARQIPSDGEVPWDQTAVRGVSRVGAPQRRYRATGCSSLRRGARAARNSDRRDVGARGRTRTRRADCARRRTASRLRRHHRRRRRRRRRADHVRGAGQTMAHQCPAA